MMPESVMVTLPPSVRYVPPTMVRPWKNSASTSCAVIEPVAMMLLATRLNSFHCVPSNCLTAVTRELNGTSTLALSFAAPSQYV